jgi:succinate dehydrogenase hydrophobic anchor subunit
MNKQLKVKYWLDLIMFLILLLTAATGFIGLFLEELESSHDQLTFLGLPPDSWEFFHILFGVLIVVLILIHLVMHLDWLSFASKKIWKKNKTKK